MKGQVVFVPAQPTAHRPNEKDIAIVHALNRYFYLTAEQICRLFFAKGSLTYVKERLKVLSDAGYVDVVMLPRSQSRGNLPFVYRLGPKGLQILRTLDEPVPYRLRRSETPVSEFHLPHTLAVNDVLISADMLTAVQPAVAVSQMLHERVLKQQPVKITLPSGRPKNVIPDAVIDFDITDQAGEGHQFVILEVDMGSKQERWRQKVERLILYGSGPFQKTYDTKSFTLAIVTPKGEAHMRNLKEWFEAVLTQQRLAGSVWQHAVFFTCQEAAETNPDAFWLSACWYTPFSHVPEKLLEVYLT